MTARLSNLFVLWLIEGPGYVFILHSVFTNETRMLAQFTRQRLDRLSVTYCQVIFAYELFRQLNDLSHRSYHIRCNIYNIYVIL